MDHSKFPLYPLLVEEMGRIREPIKIEELKANLLAIEPTPLIDYVYALLLHHYWVTQPPGFNRLTLKTTIPFSDNGISPENAGEGFTISLLDPVVQKLIYVFLKHISL